jgi:hypothetical protein
VTSCMVRVPFLVVVRQDAIAETDDGVSMSGP